MLHDWITPVDDGGNDLLVPEQKASIASTRVEDKAQANVVTLALYSEKWYFLRSAEKA